MNVYFYSKKMGEEKKIVGGGGGCCVVYRLGPISLMVKPPTEITSLISVAEETPRTMASSGKRDSSSGEPDPKSSNTDGTAVINSGVT